MNDFTKDCLRFCVRVGNDRPETFNIATANNPDANIASLAAFALAQMEEREKAEAERDQALRDYSMALSEHGLTIQEKGVAIRRAKNAEAERDRLKGELAEAEEAIRYFATKVDLARPAKFHPIDTRRTVIFSCKADGTWNHDPACSSAVRRAMERGGKP